MTPFRLTLCLVLVSIVAAFPATAGAASEPVSPTYSATDSIDVVPPGYKITGRQAQAIAERTDAAHKVRREFKDLKVAAFASNGRWEIDLYNGHTPRAEIIISKEGKVLQEWTGVAARTYYTRGHFGGLFDNPFVWLPFGILFLLPFFDPKRLFRILHLDMLVLLSFGVSYAFFTNAKPEWAIWSFYPPLAYLLVRMLAIGFGKAKGTTGRIVPMLPTVALAIGLAILVCGRVGLNIAEPKVMDVGYASVVGADRITHGEPLYVDNDQHGDTYGSINYIAYIPFELVFPYKGKWDYLPAAHAAAIAFDLLTILGLFLLGRQMRAGPSGRRLGLAMAWAWAAFPMTLLTLMQNPNDGLIAMLTVYTLLALTAPVTRGALLGLASAAKFIPGVLLPLLALGHGGKRSWRSAAVTAGVCGAVFLFSVAVYLPAGGLREWYNCTLGFQIHREPDFSAWGVLEGFHWLSQLLQVATIGLALAVAFVPRTRSTIQVAALAAAITIGLQLSAAHWLYFYIVWFVPPVLVALFATSREFAEPEPEPVAEVEPDFPTHRFAAELTSR